jgi:hypothetical protein
MRKPFSKGLPPIEVENNLNLVETEQEDLKNRIMKNQRKLY